MAGHQSPKSPRNACDTNNTNHFAIAKESAENFGVVFYMVVSILVTLKI
jgi:hypothetical protein